MPKKITKLTADQKARFNQYVIRYTKIGLCTDEADWETFENGVRECYRFAGLEPPKAFVRVESPIVLAFAASIAAFVIADLRSPGNKKKAVYSAVRSAVYSAVRSAVGSAVYSAVGSAVYSAVYSAVDSAVGSAVDSAVDSAVYSAVGSNYYHYIGGQFWVSWQGFTAFLREVCNLEFDSDIWDREKAYADAQTSAGWWWPHKDFVMVCNRPEFIKRDEQGRLHSDRSMSIRFRDGWGLWHWHGVEVTEQIILKPWQLTAKQALGEPNAEVRRVMVERIGMERFISEAGAKCIHQHEMGELFSIDLPDDPDRVLRSVRVTDPSTGRIYFLRVPPSIQRADDAVAWTFGFDPAKQYKPVVES
jgi:hypothetical protein